MGAVIYVLFGLIELLLGFRLLFRLLGANPANAFVTWVYDLSAPLVAPFGGIFGQPPITAGAVVQGVFELSTVIALIVYGLIGAILVQIFRNRVHEP